MKTILENYLYLLTEDATMESLEKEYRILLRKLKDLGSKNEQLSVKYAHTPKNQIPPEAKKIMDEYRETIEKHKELKKYKTEYSKWLRGGKVGEKPIRGVRFHFRGPGYDTRGSYRSSRPGADDFNRKMEEEIRKAMKNFRAATRLQKIKIMKVLKYGTIGLGAIVILTLAAEAYRNYRDKRSKPCDQYSGKEKQKCLILVRINAYKQQLLILKQSLSKVKTVKDKVIIQNKIKQIENKIKELQERYKKLS